MAELTIRVVSFRFLGRHPWIRRDRRWSGMSVGSRDLAILGPEPCRGV